MVKVRLNFRKISGFNKNNIMLLLNYAKCSYVEFLTELEFSCIGYLENLKNLNCDMGLVSGILAYKSPYTEERNFVRTIEKRKNGSVYESFKLSKFRFLEHAKNHTDHTPDCLLPRPQTVNGC